MCLGNNANDGWDNNQCWVQCDQFLAIISAEPVARKRKPKACEFLLLEKRKKPVTITDIHFCMSYIQGKACSITSGCVSLTPPPARPVVVHMLRDMDIMEDINDIRRVSFWYICFLCGP